MNVEPRLYQRGKRGTWWVDLGDLGGVRHRRSTGTSNHGKAQRVAQAMHTELQRHDAAARATMLVATPVSDRWREAVDSTTGQAVLARLMKNGRSRAQQRGLLWSLSDEALRSLVLRSDGRCEVTGLALALEAAARDPFKLSLDRINSREGYSPGNCRIVLLAVNLAMNAWGADLFDALAIGYASRRLHSMAQNSHNLFRIAEQSRK